MIETSHHKPYDITLTEEQATGVLLNFYNLVSSHGPREGYIADASRLPHSVDDIKMALIMAMDGVIDAAMVADFDELMIWYFKLPQFRPNVGKDHVFIAGTDVYEEILKERNGLEDELRFCCIL